MKRLLLLILMPLLLRAPAVLAAEPFTIDALHTYDNMTRPYAQGYVPLVSGDTAHIVLPLTSETCAGDITAELIPGNLSATPIKLNNSLTQRASRRSYTFSGQQIDAYKVSFKLKLHPSRLNGEYPCQIAVRGKDAAGETLTQSFPLTLRVTGARINDEIPDVAVEDFDAGEALCVGGEGMLSLRVVNRSATREARGVALTLADASGDILPKAADTLALGTLAPGASAPLEIPVRALAKASAQPHALEFKLSFTYADGKAAAKAEKHTVDLKQEVKLNHTEAALPARVTQGENVQFNLTLMNMGKGTLYNALLTFHIPHMAAGGSVLAGTLEPGKSAATTSNLRVDSGFDGDTEGTLTLTWEDGYGVNYEKTLPLSTTVSKKAVPAVAGASEAEMNGARGAKLARREIAAWCLAAVSLILFVTKTISSGRKIRKMEENRL